MYSVRISIHYATGTTNDALSEVGTLPQRNVCLIFSSNTNGKEMFYLSSPSRRRVRIVDYIFEEQTFCGDKDMTGWP